MAWPSCQSVGVKGAVQEASGCGVELKAVDEPAGGRAAPGVRREGSTRVPQLHLLIPARPKVPACIQSLRAHHTKQTIHAGMQTSATTYSQKISAPTSRSWLPHMLAMFCTWFALGTQYCAGRRGSGGQAESA